MGKNPGGEHINDSNSLSFPVEMLLAMLTLQCLPWTGALSCPLTVSAAKGLYWARGMRWK